MSLTDIAISIVLGIVEEATEFVPVSSTGHLIVAGELLGFEGDKAATFEVVIQLGAILAVVFLFGRRLTGVMTLDRGEGVAGRSGWLRLGRTTVPALVAGAAAHGFIRDQLFSPVTVAIGWGVGGVALLLVERYRPRPTQSLDTMTACTALAVGLFQCFALWPGVSRAASTIGGGMALGIDRKSAAEYSFLAALPIIGAASALELFQARDILGWADLPMFAVGFGVSFVAAWVAVRFFLHLLAVATLRPFAWYRIVASLLLLVVIGAGWISG